MKSPIFGKEKLLYFPQKSGIVPIFRKSPSSYISYFCHQTPWCIIFPSGGAGGVGPQLGLFGHFWGPKLGSSDFGAQN